MQKLRSISEIIDTPEWLDVVKYYQTHSASQTAAHFGLLHNQALVRALGRALPKSKINKAIKEIMYLAVTLDFKKK